MYWTTLQYGVHSRAVHAACVTIWLTSSMGCGVVIDTA